MANKVRKSDRDYRGKSSPDKGGGIYTKNRKASMIPEGRLDPVRGAHGFGHSKAQCDGPLRMSGDSRAHRVGK